MSVSFVYDSSIGGYYLRCSDGRTIRPGDTFTSIDGHPCEVRRIYQGWAVESVEHRPDGDVIHLDSVPLADYAAERVSRLESVRQTLDKMGRL